MLYSFKNDNILELLIYHSDEGHLNVLNIDTKLLIMAAPLIYKKMIVISNTFPWKRMYSMPGRLLE